MVAGRSYADHIERLKNKMGVRIDHIDRPLYAMMYVEETPPRIEIVPVVDSKTYIVALHELGHVALGHTQGRPGYEGQQFYFDNGVLRSEAQAWEWAMDHAYKRVPPETWRWGFNNGLGSYYASARYTWGIPGHRLYNGNRHHVAFAYNRDDEPYVLAMKERMCNAAIR